MYSLLCKPFNRGRLSKEDTFSGLIRIFFVVVLSTCVHHHLNWRSKAPTSDCRYLLSTSAAVEANTRYVTPRTNFPPIWGLHTTRLGSTLRKNTHSLTHQYLLSFATTIRRRRICFGLVVRRFTTTELALLPFYSTDYNGDNCFQLLDFCFL